MKIVVTAYLSDEKLRSHIAGAIESDQVEEIILVRRRPLAGVLKVRNICPSRIIARSRILFEFWRLIVLFKILRRESVHAIVGIQMVLHGVQAAFAGWVGRVPVAVVLIGSDVYVHLLNPLKRPVLRWALARSHVVTVMGEYARRIVLNAAVRPERVLELQACQDGERFAPNEGRPAWDLLFVGRLVPVKNIGTLLEALARARADLPDIRLGILGEGPQKDRLQALARELGVTGNVEFLGYDTEVESYLRRTRVFVLSSWSEGVPSAAIEAMLCGVPAVLTDVGDVRTVFTSNENSLLLPAGDIDALAAALREVLTNAQVYDRLRRGVLETRLRHLEKWDVSGSARAWESVLTRAVAD